MGKRKKSRYAVALGVLVAAALVFLNVMASVHVIAMDVGFYKALWARFGVSDATGMSSAELERAGKALTGYFAGSTATPQIQTVVDGQARPLYNETELTHLEDVQALFAMGFTAEKAVAGIALTGILLMLPGKRRKALGASLLAAAGASIAVLLLLAIPAKMDFGAFWTDFHLISFSNDLWLLDPNTDWLIRMFPEEFFFSTVQRIGMYSAGISILYGVFGLAVRHFSPNYRH